MSHKRIGFKITFICNDHEYCPGISLFYDIYDIKFINIYVKFI